MNDLPKEITTLAELIEWLRYYEEQYGSDVLLDVRYDSGYGHGDFTPSSFSLEDGKLRIDIS